MKDNIYNGEILVGTAFNETGAEKRVYTKKTHTFKRDDGRLHLDARDEDLQITYDKSELNRLLKANLISQEDYAQLSEDLVTIEKQRAEFFLWKEKHPNCSEEEVRTAFMKINSSHFPGGPNNPITLAIRRLVARKDRGELSKEIPALFNSIDPKNSFALTKALTDRLYRLPELLENIKCELISNDRWELSANIKTKTMGEIGLSHQFNARDDKEVMKYKIEFADWMQSAGLKTLMTYWREASLQNRFSFQSQLSSVMQHTSRSERNAYFSTKEKRAFWADTRKLEATKLKLGIKIGKKNVKIEHRLVDVGATIGDQKDIAPTTVIINVLNPTEFERQAQIGAAIHNNTLKLHPKDIMLAFSIQARGAQRRGHDLSFEEKALISRANQIKTAKSNPRKARATLNKKLDSMVKHEIIESHTKNENIRSIRQRKLKKSN